MQGVPDNHVASDEQIEFVAQRTGRANLRKARTLEGAAAQIVQRLGGRKAIKQRFRTRKQLKDAFDNAELTEIYKRKRFPNPNRFLVPFGIISSRPEETREHVADDHEVESIRSIVRVDVYDALKEQILKRVFPRARGV